VTDDTTTTTTDEVEEELPPLAALADMLADALKVVEAVDDMVNEHRHQAGDCYPMRARLAHASVRLNDAWVSLHQAHRALQGRVHPGEGR
jgi:hypothetical protein